MTTTTTKTYTILGEEFEYYELKDIARYGANTGVHGFTYSTDLADKYNEFESEIQDLLEGCGLLMHEVFAEQKFETLQQYKEWACWAFLETQANWIVDSLQETSDDEVFNF